MVNNPVSSCCTENNESVSWCAKPAVAATMSLKQILMLLFFRDTHNSF